MDCFYFLCVFPVPSLCQENAAGGEEIAGTLLKELHFLVQRDIGIEEGGGMTCLDAQVPCVFLLLKLWALLNSCINLNS